MAAAAQPRPALGPGSIRLAPLRGVEEDAFAPGAGAETTMALLRRLARDTHGQPAALDALSVTEADRLVLRLYLSVYDENAACRMQCCACDEPSEFAIGLLDIAQEQDAAVPPLAVGDLHWTLPNGARVRAPRLADLASGETLLERIVEGTVDAAEVEAWLDTAAPLMAFDIAAACPHCGETNDIRFDLAAFFAARLAGERPFLVRETHLIASRYGWSLTEIMALTRADRRAYATLIEGERSAALRSARRSA
jgi:hypothetical protein